MLELEHDFRVVDVHCRLEADADGTAARGRAVTPETLELELSQAGIVRAVVFPGPEPESYLRANNAVARHAVDRPFTAFARLDGPRDPTGTPVAKLRGLAAARREEHLSPDDVEQYGYGDRFHGFKLDPGRDGLPTEAVLDVLEAVELPVLVHVGERFPPGAVEATLLTRSFPVILAHFGGYPLNRDLMAAALDLLGEFDACYVDTSVVRYRHVLERAMLEHPDRVLFGSGAPDVHPTVGLMEILTLDVPEDAMRKAFSNNPSRVIPALAPA
ncbi:MAG: amidohydrolase family protein [Halobacteriales archaeon]